MTDHPKPSAAALAKADEICKKHGMLPGGYMRDSLAEDLETYADRVTTCLRTMRDHLVTNGLVPYDVLEEARQLVYPPDTMLGVPITAAEREAISKDGP